jgi:thioredoxin-related protein
MRIGTVLLVLFFCAASVSAQIAAPQTFLKQWADAKKAAAKDKKPIYIHFTTRSCKWCRKIEKETYPDAAVKKALGDYVCVTLDCTEAVGGWPAPDSLAVNLSLMDRLGGGGYPFLAMVTADGLRLNSLMGFASAKTLIKELAAAKAVYKEYQAFMAYANDLKTDKKSYDFARKSLAFYSKVHDEEHAMTAAQTVLEQDPENAKGDQAPAKLAMLEFSHDAPDKTVTLMEDVCKLDPQNEKNAFEQAMSLQIFREFREVRTMREDPADATPHMEALLKLVEKARANESKLKEIGKIYRVAAQACFMLEQFDKSLEWAQRALAASKNPQESNSLKSFIDQIKAAKQKSASAASKPAR